MRAAARRARIWLLKVCGVVSASMAKWYEYDPGPPEPFDHSDDGKRGWALTGLFSGVVLLFVGIATVLWAILK
jgi:hypothetical protein